MWRSLVALVLLAGCTETSVQSAIKDQFQAELMSGQWTARTFSEMAELGSGPILPTTKQGTIAFALTHPVAVAVLFCNPDNDRPIAALFAPERSDWKHAPEDDDFPFRVRADDGRWHTFSARFLSEEGVTVTRSTRMVGVTDHDAIRIADIIGQAHSEIWMDAGGRQHRMFADDQRLVTEALDACRASLGPAPEEEA